MSDKFPESCLVVLRSGGPVMVVEDTRADDFIAAVWFTACGELMRDSFHPNSLFVVDK